MRIVAGPFAIACTRPACTLLAIGGFAKAWRPGDTAHALTLVGVPLRRATVRAVVRVGGAAEAVLALAAAVSGAPLAAAGIAVSYLAFAAFVVVALRRG